MPPNWFSRPPASSIHRIDMILEEEPSTEKSNSSINMIDLNQFNILASLDSKEMNVHSDF